MGYDWRGYGELDVDELVPPLVQRPCHVAESIGLEAEGVPAQQVGRRFGEPIHLAAHLVTATHGALRRVVRAKRHDGSRVLGNTRTTRRGTSSSGCPSSLTGKS